MTPEGLQRARPGGGADRRHRAVAAGRGAVIPLAATPESDIVLADSRVSWRHGVIRVDGPDWVFEDTGSTNGTFSGQQRVQRMAITAPLALRLGHPDDGVVMSFSVAIPAQRPAVVPQPRNPQVQPVMPGGGISQSRLSGERMPSAVMRLPTKLLRIGRAADNDVVVSDLSVSRYHAELRRDPRGGYEIVDLGSHNGTFVNGQRVTSAPVTERDIIGIGPATFRLVGEELQEFIDTGDISLTATDLTVAAAERQGTA